MLENISTFISKTFHSFLAIENAGIQFFVGVLFIANIVFYYWSFNTMIEFFYSDLKLKSLANKNQNRIIINILEFYMIVVVNRFNSNQQALYDKIISLDFKPHTNSYHFITEKEDLYLSLRDEGGWDNSYEISRLFTLTDSHQAYDFSKEYDRSTIKSNKTGNSLSYELSKPLYSHSKKKAEADKVINKLWQNLHYHTMIKEVLHKMKTPKKQEVIPSTVQELDEVLIKLRPASTLLSQIAQNKDNAS